MPFCICFPPEMTFVMAYVVIFFSPVSSAESNKINTNMPFLFFGRNGSGSRLTTVFTVTTTFCVQSFHKNL